MTLPKDFSTVPKRLFSKLRNEKKRSFVYIDGKEAVKISQKSDLILSPSFYWVVKERLPVTKLREAKKLFSSVTEGSLPEGDYRFIGLQDSDDPHLFTIIAYDENKIAEKLENLGIRKEQVAHLFFVQSFLQCLEKPVIVDEKNAIDQSNGIIFNLPRNLVSEAVSLDTFLQCAQKVNAKSVHISFDRTLLAMESDNVLKISVALTVLAILFIAEAGYYWWIDRSLLRQNANIATHYRIPATGYQRKAVIKKLLRRRDRVAKQRKTFETLFHLPLESHETVEHFNYLKNKISLSIHVASQKRAQQLLDALASKITVLNSTFEKGLLTIEAKQ